MNNVDKLLLDLEKKFGRVIVDACNEEACSACTYDDDCISCKGNAMGN